MLKINALSTLAVITLSLINGAACAAAESAGNLNVTVRGANNDKGVIRIAVYNNKDAYAADKDNTATGSFRKEAVLLKDNSANSTFKDVPYGQYAIKLFHDEDNSGKFYTGMFGIPKVQYGFSNNAKGMMGPAPYAKALFAVKTAETNMTIDLSK
jgi:uncharacterized protein (DUF2141 family)